VKFEIRYPTGSPHEVTLQGTVAILGRDPSCDLVLNDPRCSRRHAVIEAGPQGLSIRDTGSANGVAVNGEKVERAGLKPGDEVRLGEIVLKVLPENLPGTVVMGPDEMEDFHGSAPPAAAASAPPPPPRTNAPAASPNTAALPVLPTPPAPASPPAPPRPAAPAPPRPAGPPLAQRPVPPPRPASPPRPPAPPRPEAPLAEDNVELVDAQGPIPRSTAVTLLVALWALGILLYAGLGLWLAATVEGMARVAGVALGGLLALLSAAMAFGLWARRGWARTLQIVLAGLGILTCVFAPVSLAILIYMLRAGTRLQFSDHDLAELSPEEAEAATRDASGLPFTVAFLGTLLLSLLLLGGAGALFRTLGMAVPSLGQARSAANDSAAIGSLRTMASGQQAFRAGTCDGYADLDGLMNPSSVIPNYPAGGPAFLPPEFAQAERDGYRYELRVEEPLPAQEGCPQPLYRRYGFSATPVSGSGRHFLIESEGVIHVAQDRPATPQDPSSLE
jgi:hypothetical protein